MTGYILYRNYLNSTLSSVSVGGIQTYITKLSEIMCDNGYDVVIVQFGKENKSLKSNNITVETVFSLKADPKDLMKRVKKIAAKDSLVIFGTEDLIVPSCFRSIAIQHGIAWDKESPRKVSGFINNLSTFYKAYRSSKKISKLSNVERTICVDNNFISWYRTQVANFTTKLVYLPNFAVISPIIEKPTDTINIIFARRFFKYRGTCIFATAIKRLLAEYGNIDVTFAGEGPDEEWLKKQLGTYSNVHFTKYESNESLTFHADKHIAAVPSIGSEGTSFSLLEAMSSQCAVVCTNVGGMTNIIIDRYNGLMVNPDDESIYQALKELIDDDDLRQKLAKRGYETVKEGFSYQLWEKRWVKELREISQ